VELAKSPMTNIPTDLLRTLVAVVDLRSFTKAAHALGVTQPAVSAQIKRLQSLLGTELLDKTTPGVALTDTGALVVKYARRLLAINDQIFSLSYHGPAVDQVRVGITCDLFEASVLNVLADFRRSEPGVRLHVAMEPSETLLRDLHHGEFDLVIALNDGAPAENARHAWLEPLAWVAHAESGFDPRGPTSLIVPADGGLLRRVALVAVETGRQPYDIVLSARSLAAMTAAASAGLGVFCWPRRAVLPGHLVMREAAPRLPKLPDVFCGVHVRADTVGTAVHALADAIAAVIAPSGVATGGALLQAASR
jgi:DNA-binding transcriptional LysR family regulator